MHSTGYDSCRAYAEKAPGGNFEATRLEAVLRGDRNDFAPRYALLRKFFVSAVAFLLKSA